MREIKFRAWLPAIKKMTYTHTLDELMNWNTKEEDNGTAIWLQYTGLKDKNGVEIYEGDILRNKKGLVCSVAWHGSYAGFVKSWKKEGHDKLYDFASLYLTYMSCEVIGNIYENQELLRGENYE